MYFSALPQTLLKSIFSLKVSPFEGLIDVFKSIHLKWTEIGKPFI